MLIDEHSLNTCIDVLERLVDGSVPIPEMTATLAMDIKICFEGAGYKFILAEPERGALLDEGYRRLWAARRCFEGSPVTNIEGLLRLAYRIGTHYDSYLRVEDGLVGFALDLMGIVVWGDSPQGKAMYQQLLYRVRGGLLAQASDSEVETRIAARFSAAGCVVPRYDLIPVPVWNDHHITFFQGLMGL